MVLNGNGNGRIAESISAYATGDGAIFRHYGSIIVMLLSSFMLYVGCVETRLG